MNTKTVNVRFTASFEVEMEVPVTATLRDIGELLCDVDIPETESVRYIRDTFEPDVDAYGDPRLYPVEEKPRDDGL